MNGLIPSHENDVQPPRPQTPPSKNLKNLCVLCGSFSAQHTAITESNHG